MRAMPSRRTFLRTIGGAVAALPVAAHTHATAQRASNAFPRPVSGPIGLQLYSLRHLFQKGDVAATLALVRDWGFSVVEGGPLNGMSAADSAALLKKHGLRAAGTGADYGKLRDGGVDASIADAKALGAESVMVAWIPHEGRFTVENARRAADDFNTWGKRFRDAGLRFAYHIHGYEFLESPDGTLFDTIARYTDRKTVDFEMDVFWVARGGGDPVELLDKYAGRFLLTHLKDIRKGTKLCDPTGGAPDDTSVPLGDGMIDWPGVLRAAEKQGTKYHFIEDEHPEAEKQIPRTLQYLSSLSL
jgi:sugar phosphate isomerase/epimerase